MITLNDLLKDNKMYTTFPQIGTIDDIIDVIKNKTEFALFEREHFNLISYNIVSSETFDGPDADLLRECRGITFDKQGFILARPLHKFFNLNEKEETQVNRVPIKLNHVIMNKMDGSMVFPIFITALNKFQLLTKRGMSEVAMIATEFAAKNPKFEKFFLHCMSLNVTPIFEYVGPYNKIVLDYKQEGLYLLALRNKFTGIYVLPSEMKKQADAFDIDCVDMYPATRNLKKFANDVKHMKDIEGFVLRFNNGLMLKIKTEEYVIKHKSVDLIANERNLVKLILEGNIDDLKSIVENDERKIVEKLEKNVYNYFVKMGELSKEKVKLFEKYESKKELALDKNLSTEEKNVIFASVSGNIRHYSEKKMKNALKTLENWDKFKQEHF